MEVHYFCEATLVVAVWVQPLQKQQGRHAGVFSQSKQQHGQQLRL
jgi:hypothetical protein